MAVFRIEKTRDYTVMSNHHLRDKSLSLKAKGLLSLMLSLPEEWDYTTKGLARICKDGVDSICAGVRELEEHGYVIRQRVRNPNGQLGAIEYTILEQPRPPEPENPKRENPVLDHIISTVRKYTRAKVLTPRMLNELIDHIEVHQAEKIDGIWEQHLVIHYNCVGAIFIPDVFPLPAPQVSVNTRKGVVVNYAPGQLAV